MYLLFAGDTHYADGGAWDYRGTFESPTAARAAHDPTQFRYEGGWANVMRAARTLTNCGTKEVTHEHPNLRH
jgi:hypothetical protein